jgi:pentatricopeptide repeat protein
MCKQGQAKEVLEILKATEYPVDSCTYIFLLQGCIRKKALSDGKLVHAHINERGFMAHRIVRNTLVDMYAKCGSLVDARRVFDQLPERDVFSWTFIISAHAKHGLAEEALTLYRQMKQTGIQPDQFTFTGVFPACATLAALEEVHGDITVRGFQSDVFVGTALVDMYAKCGRMEKARDLFDKMPQRNAVSWTALIAGYAHNGDVDEALRLFHEIPERNVVSWTVMIAGCVQNGYNEEALEIFHEMQLAGVKPSLKTFASIFPACANLLALEQGMRIHEEIIRCGVQFDAFVESALIDMYAKCGSIEKARDVFDKMHQQNVVLWNAMIACYAQNGYGEEAMNLYKQMPRAGVKPNLKTFASALSACADLTDIEQGIEIHEEIIRKGFEFDVFVGSALINMYVKCGSIEKAHDLFDKMPERNIVSCTAMAAGYAMCGHVQEALTIFERMPGKDMVSWNAIVAGFVESGNVGEAHKLFQDMPTRNMVSWTIMIAGYAQSGHIGEALKLFLKLPQKNTVSWTAMIAGYSQNDNNEEAVNLFRQMQIAGVKPNSKTFASVISACANLASLEHGMEIHREIIRSGYQTDVFVESALICQMWEHRKGTPGV